MTILTFNVATSGATTGFRPSLSVPEAFWDMRLRTALKGEAGRRQGEDRVSRAGAREGPTRSPLTMDCHHLDSLLEALADGSAATGADAQAHLDACPACAAQLAGARAIEGALRAREAPAMPAGFTAAVLMRVRRERWKVEQAFDIGFNLTLAAGLLSVLVGGIGPAWNAGFLAIDVDLGGLAATAATSWISRVAAEARTVAMAAVLLTVALGAWWWAESGTPFRL